MVRLLLFLVLLASVLGGCIGSPRSDREAFEGLERLSYDVTLRSDDGIGATWTVSGVRSGEREAARLVYVHGTPADASFFVDYLVDPIVGYESISVDRPGFGATRPIRSLTGFSDQAAALAPLLVERDGRWPILIGHSLGAPIVARAAADYPDRVGGVVILGGSLDPALEKPRWFNHVGRWSFVRWVVGPVLNHSNDEIFAAVEETRLLDGVLHRVRCPVCVVHGTDDWLVPIGNVAYMRRVFPNARSMRVEVLEGEGHFFPWSREDVVRDVIRWIGDQPR